MTLNNLVPRANRKFRRTFVFAVCSCKYHLKLLVETTAAGCIRKNMHTSVGIME